MSASGLQLRDYQAECIGIIDNLDSGAHLVQMATGLGKTVTFANIHRHGRMLILSHRDELVAQPVKYFDCPVGIEKAERHSNGEPVVSGSVQTLSRGTRLQRNFKPGDFDLIVTDEAHHALAPTYQKIVDYLQPRLHIGFTATPNRGDGRGLDDVFEDIVFQRDLLWGIRHGYLCDIDCMQVEVEWSTKGVKRVAGDFQLSALNDAVNRPKSNAQVAEAYRQFHRGQTLIFASSVDHAYALADLIEGAVVVDGKTPMDERRQIIADFTDRKIPVIINFGVFTEGTDMPLIETVLLARPTRNSTLYTQMVGRGLRLYEDPETGYKKKDLLLIDCVGDSDRNDICTAPSLIGIDPSELDENEQRAVRGTRRSRSHPQPVQPGHEHGRLRYRGRQLHLGRGEGVQGSDEDRRAEGGQGLDARRAEGRGDRHRQERNVLGRLRQGEGRHECRYQVHDEADQW